MNQASYDLNDLIQRQRRGDDLYLEFLHESALSCGLYVLPAGIEDPQQPHAEDEVYYIIDGHGSFIADGVDHRVGPGTILYVKKQIEHRFHLIDEDLIILVFFAAG